ncbi:MAG: large-conductance mechanosensitive channel protein MscL [Polyangiaceae bacterium]|nr:large-conductance mechanosensitive channel protein MscL [Polyangiaceae bacterium]
MSIVKEFKEFAVKGNVIDLAVGVIIGAAFGKIVSSFVADIVTPPLGALTGGVDFRDLELVIQQAEGEKAAVALKYGTFLQATFDFLIVAVAIFFMVKMINRLKRKEEAAPAAPPEPTEQEKLLAEIRDLLKERQS